MAIYYTVWLTDANASLKIESNVEMLQIASMAVFLFIFGTFAKSFDSLKCACQNSGESVSVFIFYFVRISAQIEENPFEINHQHFFWS